MKYFIILFAIGLASAEKTGRYSTLDEICYKMADCHKNTNETKAALCINENMEHMHKTLDQNIDDPEFQLSGLYYTISKLLSLIAPLLIKNCNGYKTFTIIGLENVKI